MNQNLDSRGGCRYVGIVVVGVVATDSI